MNIILDYLKAKIDKFSAQALNSRTYQDYFLRLVDLSINVYEWHNLPDSVDERFLELALFNHGVAVCFEDTTLGGVVVGKTMYGGNLDIYATPGDRRMYAVNGYNKNLDAKNSVLVFNNRLRIPSASTIQLFAMRLTNLERTCDVNLNAQKTPVLVLCTDKQRLTLKQVYDQYQGNEPVIFGTKGLDDSPIRVEKTDAPFLADKLSVQKNRVWNEAMTFIGIETANTDKAERLITDEVTSNLGTAEAQRYTKLNARRDAAKQINKMFGTKIEVDFRSHNTIIDTSIEGKSKTPEAEETEVTE